MRNKTAYNNNWGNHFANKFGSKNEHAFKKAWKQKMQGAFATPPVNVRELDDKYELHLFAAGFSKSDFSIALTDQILSISTQKKDDESEEWKRREHVLQGFTRKFELNEKVDKSAISAIYENGVLILTLPKLEGFETERQEIEIG